MIQARETILVAQPLEATFHYISDMSHAALWDPSVITSRRTDQAPIAQGSRFALKLRAGLQRLPVDYRIEVFEPHQRLEMIGRAPTFVAHDVVQISRKDAGTLIDWTLNLEMLGPYALVEPLMGPLVRRMGRHAMGGLRQALTEGLFEYV